MKDLPPATLGADLRESVLRRAERAMLLSGERASASGPSEIGLADSRWPVEAGLVLGRAALAAGLLLMVFQREPARSESAMCARRCRAMTTKRALPLEVRSARRTTTSE